MYKWLFITILIDFQAIFSSNRYDHALVIYTELYRNKQEIKIPSNKKSLRVRVSPRNCSSSSATHGHQQSQSWQNCSNSDLIRLNFVKSGFELKDSGGNINLCFNRPDGYPVSVNLNSLIQQDHCRIDHYTSNLPKGVVKSLQKHGISKDVVNDLYFEFIGVTSNGKKRVYRSTRTVDGCIHGGKWPRTFHIDLFVDNYLDSYQSNKINVARTDIYNDTVISHIIQVPGNRPSSGLIIDQKCILKNVADECKQAINLAQKDKARHYQKRLDAVNQTLTSGYKFDYSSQVQHPKFSDSYADAFKNCYGTYLDKQLHEELCDTRVIIMKLQENYADNLHVRAFAPFIYQATGLAKQERTINKAFNLSDFSYDLAQIVSEEPGRAGYCITLANGQAFSSDEVKNFIDINSAINKSLKNLVSENSVLQRTCKINETIIEIAEKCELHDDLEDALWLAGTVRDISLGVLEYGKAVKNDPAKFIAGYLLNPLNFVYNLLTCGTEYLICHDALESGNVEYMQFALENLHKEQARQKQDLEAWITQIKKMTYEEFCRNIGYGGADFIANYGVLKACGLGLGKSEPLIEKFKEFKNLVNTEKQLAGTTKMLTPTQACFENIANVIKSAFEKGKEDLLSIFGVLEKNPELVEIEGSVENAVARIAGDFEKEKASAGKGSVTTEMSKINHPQSIVGTAFDEIKPTQSFVNKEKVDEYISKLLAGENIPPIVVYEVPGKGIFISEGHHRFIASKEAGIPVKIIIKSGSGPVGLPNWSKVSWKQYANENQFWE